MQKNQHFQKKSHAPSTKISEIIFHINYKPVGTPKVVGALYSTSPPSEVSLRSLTTELGRLPGATGGVQMWAAAQNWGGIWPDPESEYNKWIPNGSRHIRVDPGLWRGFRVVPAL